MTPLRPNPLRTIAHAIYFGIALLVWVVTVGARLRAKRRVVLCYHGVTAAQADRFARQMRMISGRIVPIEALDTPPTGRGRPDVILTFDDAFVNLIDRALPTLRDSGAPATIFAVAGNLGEPPKWSMPAGHPDRAVRTMTEAELIAVARDPGVRIGSHTMTHPSLDRLDAERAREELVTSRDRLESMLGGAIEDLALPHGAGTAETIRLARDAGYRRVLTLEHECEPSRLGAGVIGRFSVSPDTPPIAFRLIVDGAYGWLGPMRRAVRRLSGRASRGNSAAPLVEASA